MCVSLLGAACAGRCRGRGGADAWEGRVGIRGAPGGVGRRRRCATPHFSTSSFAPSIFPSSSDKVVVASAGFQADGKTLAKVLHSRHVSYVHDHRRPMPVSAAAQLLGNTLYYKRFFPSPLHPVRGLGPAGPRRRLRLRRGRLPRARPLRRAGQWKGPRPAGAGQPAGRAVTPGPPRPGLGGDRDARGAVR